MKLVVDCREVSRLISQRMDEAMPPAERARLRYHLVICRACRTVEEQLGFLRRAIRTLDKEPPPER